jgi:LCP family protein required for cell wall assembly
MGMGFGVWFLNWQIDNKVAGINRVDVTVDELPTKTEAANYLIVGSDSRDFTTGDPNAEKSFGDVSGRRSDTILIAHVEPESKKVLLVSIPRDLVVDIPGIGRQKINAAFNEGPQKVIETVQTNFDIPVHHYLNVDFASFKRLVDLVGTVPVYFPYPARDEVTGLDIAGTGCVPLNGDQALAYVRSREYEEFIDGDWITDPTADLGRIQRQQGFIRQLAAVAKGEVLADPLRTPQFADAALANLEADGGLGRSEILGFVGRFRDVDPNDSKSVEMITVPTVAGPAGTSLGSHLLLDEDAAAPILERLRTFGPVPATSTTSSVSSVTPTTPSSTISGTTTSTEPPPPGC